MMSVIHSTNCKNLYPITDYATGEIACASCGSVILEKAIDAGPELIGITKEEYESNTRVGTKLTLKLSDMGLSTVIQSSNKDSTGKNLSSENSKIFYRLRLWDRNSKSKQEYKSFNKAFILLDAIRAKIGLPNSVVEKSAYFFRKAAVKKILGGRSTSGILCAAVYLSCRVTGTPRTLQDIADAGNIKRKILQKAYRFLAKELDINPESYSPSDFVERIVNEVGAGKKTRLDALHLMDKVLKAGIGTSKNPMSMAAAVVNLVSISNKEKISQLKISKASGISSVTIRDRSKEIRKKLGGEW